MVARSDTRRRAAVYIRVSTSDQHTENQRPELLQLADVRGFEVVEVVEERVSASKKRAGFDRVLALAHRGGIHAVIVFALDRIGRSMVDNLQVVLELDRLGVEVVSSRVK